MSRADRRRRACEPPTMAALAAIRRTLRRRYGVDLELAHYEDWVVVRKIIVPAEQRRSGLGSAAMADLAAAADTHDWQLALTPDVAYGATSRARLVRFYRRFGFVPNKGRRRDFTTQEAMIRARREGSVRRS